MHAWILTVSSFPLAQSFCFVGDMWGGTLSIPDRVRLINKLEGPTKFKVRCCRGWVGDEPRQRGSHIVAI